MSNAKLVRQEKDSEETVDISSVKFANREGVTYLVIYIKTEWHCYWCAISTEYDLFSTGSDEAKSKDILLNE